MAPASRVSVVIPVFNERENIPRLHQELVDALDGQEWDWESIWVDDRSTDGSHALLQEVVSPHPKCSVVRLRRRMGQTQAIAAGLDQATGDVVVFIDSDLQNPPCEIPRLVNALGTEWDVISGWRKDRKDGFILRRLPSIMANSMISGLLGFTIHDYGCSLKAYRRPFLDGFAFLGDAHRLLPAYAVLQGARLKEIEVVHRPREWGTSKYGLGRVFKVLIDVSLLKFYTTYSTRPAHFFASFGYLLTLISIFLSVFVVVRRSLGGDWMSPLLIVACCGLFAGFQIIVLSLTFEIMHRDLLRGFQWKTYELEIDITPKPPGVQVRPGSVSVSVTVDSADAADTNSSGR